MTIALAIAAVAAIITANRLAERKPSNYAPTDTSRHTYRGNFDIFGRWHD